MKLENLTIDGHSIRDSSGATVAVSMDVGTAEKIAAALNAHDQLVEVAKEHLALLLYQKKDGAHGGGIRNEIEATRAALTAAGAQP